MKGNEILRLKTLIEIYDRELKTQGRFHVQFFPCKRCKSLFKQRQEMIMKLKEAWGE